MGILEVVLLIAGIVIFIGSFLLPSGKESGINKEAAKEEIKGLMAVSYTHLICVVRFCRS